MEKITIDSVKMQIHIWPLAMNSEDWLVNMPEQVCIFHKEELSVETVHLIWICTTRSYAVLGSSIVLFHHTVNT